MAKKDKKFFNSFFLNMLVMSLAFMSLLVVTYLVRKPQNTRTSAAPRQNFTASFGPLGTPDSSWDTAGELIAILQANDVGTIVKQVYTYDGGLPSTMSGVDPIEEGKGYLIDFYHNPGSNFYKLFNDYSTVRSQSYSLPLSTEGPYGPDFGNLISIPEGVMQRLGRMRAEDLCDTLNSNGASVTVVAATEKAVFQKTRLYDENMVFHTCGTRANNFSVTSGLAYFVWVDAPSTVVLP